MSHKTSIKCVEIHFCNYTYEYYSILYIWKFGNQNLTHESINRNIFLAGKSHRK